MHVSLHSLHLKSIHVDLHSALSVSVNFLYATDWHIWVESSKPLIRCSSFSLCADESRHWFPTTLVIAGVFLLVMVGYCNCVGSPSLSLCVVSVALCPLVFLCELWCIGYRVMYPIAVSISQSTVHRDGWPCFRVHGHNASLTLPLYIARHSALPW